MTAPYDGRGELSDQLCACGCGQRTTVAPRSRSERGVVKGQPNKFLMRHSGLPDYFMRYVRPALVGCWLWEGKIARNGYGLARIRNRSIPAHRAVYERLVGPIPVGLEIDHLCCVRACVNPDHLEPVTHRENVIRGVEGRARRLAGGAA